MTLARSSHTATLLTDGLVLITGGANDASVQASAELYDPATGKFSPTGSMGARRHGHTATRLTDGRVLIVGGLGADSNPVTYLASAEIYNPATGKFSPTGSMAHPRYGHTETLLSDGRVLVAGGYGALAEIYNPATGKFSPTGPMTVQRMNHTATLLPSGRVLVTGGENLQSGFQASAEVYDPGTGKFTRTGALLVGRGRQSATLLPTGLVLIAGGWANPTKSHAQSEPVAEAELFNPATGKFSTTGSMAHARYSQVATQLSDGRVLLTGGVGSTVQVLATAEVYDPGTGKFSSTGPMAVAAYAHTATLLLDGSVLIAGGVSNSAVLVSAELWRP